MKKSWHNGALRRVANPFPKCSKALAFQWTGFGGKCLKKNPTKDQATLVTFDGYS